MAGHRASHGRNESTTVSAPQRQPAVRCSGCADARWVKAYTPWGCPTCVRCPQCGEACAGPAEMPESETRHRG